MREAVSRRVPAIRSGAFVAAFGPHVALGGYLAFVPDRTLFTATQVAVVAHVVLALVTLPILSYWLVRHIGTRLGTRSVGVTERPAVTRAVRLALTAGALAAFATGLVLLGSGDGMPAATWHRWAGLLAVVPFVAHLAVERGRAQAVALASSLAVMAVVFGLAWLLIPAAPASPASPAFAARTRANAGYDQARWCGECHTGVFAEWSRSTHSRSLQIPSVLADFTGSRSRLPLQQFDSDLAHATPNDGPPCVHCHMPTSFYGDDPAAILSAPAPARDGVTCSFCHTLRGVNEVPRGANGSPQLAFYVSAPDTVRRYLGQNARNPALRAMGNLLIRWRPAMHRRDYHVPFLNTAAACLGCHGINPRTTYADWEHSSYATDDPRTETTCQDCHMVRAMTGRPVREPGTLVPWGPERPQRRTHFFLGGNVQAPEQLNDRGFARREHAFVDRALRLVIESAAVRGGVVRLVARVYNDRIGHAFPGMETSQRIAWIEVQLRDADGQVLYTSPRPEMDPARDAPRRDTPSPVMYRDRERRGETPIDTTVPAHGSQLYVTEIPWDHARATPVSLSARVRNSFDPEPIAQADGAITPP